MGLFVRSLRLLPLVAGLGILLSGNIVASTILKSGSFGGSKIEYKVVLPPGFDSKLAYPVILAFAGGTQDMRMVDVGLKAYWAAEAERRGYIVVSPAAPDEQLFFESSDRIFPEFLDMIRREYNVAGGRLHVVGTSSGGVAAFHVASLYPKYFWSVTVLPGYLNDTTEPIVDALKPLCIFMYVGDLDKEWLRAMTQQAELFRKNGINVQFVPQEEQGHHLDLGPDGMEQLFADLDKSTKNSSK